MALPSCIVCGEEIGGESTAWCHARCVTGDGYDLRAPFSSWPEWARWAKRDEEAKRYNERKRIRRGVETYTVADLTGDAEGDNYW